MNDYLREPVHATDVYLCSIVIATLLIVGLEDIKSKLAAMMKWMARQEPKKPPLKLFDVPDDE
jgi:hypothetical protein